ncbi:unnamed protein product [Eruca vesicaria subsp. sativa]|uniref:F-box associated beta-propeller type 1 domain-containing protein n=1 Tax=Eruca vesicaria subsp. sativa TaxID=29727 RepID=A0ABC8LYK7_ERUVS|nr:unnamed protein product [Eruca vesicaria subsp. sativa]
MKKFDFTTERFVNLPLPIPSCYLVDDAVLSVVGDDEKLSVSHFDYRSYVMRIWVSNKVEEAKDLSWRSDVVLKVDFNKFIWKVDFDIMYVESFLFDEENKVAISCDLGLVEDEKKARIYIVGEDMFKQVYKSTVKVTHLDWPRVITYVPSLVRIQESTPKGEKKRRFALT